MANRRNNIYEALKNLWAVALSLTFFIATFIPSWNRYVILFNNDKIHFTITLILNLLIFIVFITYAIYSHSEIDFLRENLEGISIPRIKYINYVTIFSLAIFFGLLIIICDNILLFSILIVCYSLVNIWAGFQQESMLRLVIENKLHSNITCTERSIIETIKRYYIDKPNIQRIVTFMFFNWTGMSISIIFYFTSEVIFRNLAYIIIILNIVFSEGLLFIWRIKKNKEIIIYDN